METFALVVFLTFGGQTNAFVIDHGLTREDCIAEIAHGKPVEIAPGFVVDPTRGNASCQPETKGQAF